MQQCQVWSLTTTVSLKITQHFNSSSHTMMMDRFSLDHKQLKQTLWGKPLSILFYMPTFYERKPMFLHLLWLIYNNKCCSMLLRFCIGFLSWRKYQKLPTFLTQLTSSLLVCVIVTLTWLKSERAIRVRFSCIPLQLSNIVSHITENSRNMHIKANLITGWSVVYQMVILCNHCWLTFEVEITKAAL